MEIITEQRAIDLLRQVVATKGADITVPSSGCVYFLNGQPSCLIGHAMALVGISKDDLTVTDEGFTMEFNESPLGPIITPLAESGVLSLHTKAEAVWQAAQDAQDAGRTWGQALAAAEEVLA